MRIQDGVNARTDQDLVRASAAGSREAAAELFERHWDVAWRVGYAVTGDRALAEDVAQDAFQRAFRALADFDLSRPFRPWLHRIVVNRALDLVRRNRRLVDHADADEPAADWVEERLRDADLFAALGRLSPERRAVVVLRYWLDYTQEEIARMLELPIGTVSSRLTRALSALRSEMEKTNVG